MSLTPRGMSIQEAYRLFRDDSFIVNRKYQRKLVWTVEEKEFLVDSILNGLPIPLILLAQIGDKKFEIKKIKKAKDTIRFGTNIDLDTINSFRYVTFGLKKIFSSKEYRDGEKIKQLSDSYDHIMAGSEASVTSKKLQLFYLFIEKLKEYTLTERSQKSLSSKSSEGKQFIFKAADVDKDVYFKLSIDDLKTAVAKGKHQTTIERTEDKQDTEELTSFSEDVDSLLSTFLTKYPTIESFKIAMVDQLYDKYKQAGVHIMIIDQKNDFLIDPTNFEFNAINQYVRPQVTLK
jgi:hypothetical protein